MQYIIYIIYIFKYLFCGIPHVHFRVNTFREKIIQILLSLYSHSVPLTLLLTVRQK